MSVKHILHYNTNPEQQYFRRQNTEYYDLIAINGNIVSHTPQGIAAFLSTINKHFYIDPQTHAFQHPTKSLKRPDGTFKPSIVKLAKERLGSIFGSVIDSNRPITPDKFRLESGDVDHDIIEDICKSVIEFQKFTMHNSLDDEAKEFIGDVSDFSPDLLVAPYFYLTKSHYLEWLEINSLCYQKSHDLFPEELIAYSLVLSRHVIDSDSARKDIEKEIKKIKPKVILLWIDDFNEETAVSSEICKFISLLKAIKAECDTQIYNIHGGYFSQLLTHQDLNLLNGVGHSVNYGEHRNVIPVGGGIPMARFYFRPTHTRLRFGDALSIMLDMNWIDSVEDYHSKVCKCEQCLELIKVHNSDIGKAIFAYGDSNPVISRRRSGTIVRLEYPTREAKQIASWHYLYNKAIEFEEIRAKSLSELRDELSNNYNELFPVVGDKHTSHLSIWHDALDV